MVINNYELPYGNNYIYYTDCGKFLFTNSIYNGIKNFMDDYLKIDKNMFSNDKIYSDKVPISILENMYIDKISKRENGKDVDYKVCTYKFIRCIMIDLEDYVDRYRVLNFCHEDINGNPKEYLTFIRSKYLNSRSIFEIFKIILDFYIMKSLESIGMNPTNLINYHNNYSYILVDIYKIPNLIFVIDYYIGYNLVLRHIADLLDVNNYENDFPNIFKSKTKKLDEFISEIYKDINFKENFYNIFSDDFYELYREFADCFLI